MSGMFATRKCFRLECCVAKTMLKQLKRIQNNYAVVRNVIQTFTAY
jgi:hypothetical protein